MYPNAVILEVRRLLAEGELSRRAVAAKVGVSRGFVNNVANGVRGLRCHGDVRPRTSREHTLGTAMRCSHCGGLVYGACLLCRARDHRRKAVPSRRDAPCGPASRRRPPRVA